MSAKNWLGLFTGFLALGLGGASAHAGSDDDALAADIEAQQPATFDLGSHTLVQVIPAIETLRTEGNLGKTSCVETSVKENSKRIVTSFNAEGQPCKIYDLSFPVLLPNLKKMTVGVMPLERFDSAVVRAWLHGDDATLASQVESFRSTLSSEDVRNSWYGALPFKQPRAENLTSDLSFNLADLDFGGQFTLSREDAMGIQKLLALAGAENDGMNEFVRNPESLLQRFQFRWNGADKVFEIIADLDFLPLVPPVAVVDYQIQYKLAVEKLVRSAILNTLNYATRFIPNAVARRVVSVALNDSFEFIQMAYDYQLNRLESTLEMNLAGVLPTDIAKTDVEKGLNILFAQRGDLLQQYILARVLQQKFDLNHLDLVGKTTRYQTLKTRESTRANLHSSLVLKKNCQTEIKETYFATCTTPDGKRSLYSLLSSQKIFIFDMGPAMLHSFDAPRSVMQRRTLAWQLSSAIRMFPLPIPGMLNDQLVSIAKSYAQTGALDEGFLLNPISERRVMLGQSDQFSEYFSTWLRKQNLVPFATRSEQKEQELVVRARQSLQMRVKP